MVGTDGSKQALDDVRAAGKLANLCSVKEVHVVAACRTYSQYEIEQIEAELSDEFHDLVSPHLEAQDRFIEVDQSGASLVVRRADRRARLRTTPSMPEAPSETAAIETHISTIFFTHDRAYKLLKPVTFSFLG